MPKTEVYSWRVSAAVKQRIEAAARRERRTVAALLDEIVMAHLLADARAAGADDAHQRQLHVRAARFAGCLAGSDPGRSAGVRDRVRARLHARRRHAR